MLHVFRASYPFQIAGDIVMLITILMIYLVLRWAWTDKRLSNEDMNQLHPVLTIFPELHTQVLITRLWFKEPTNSGTTAAPLTTPSCDVHSLDHSPRKGPRIRRQGATLPAQPSPHRSSVRSKQYLLFSLYSPLAAIAP